MPRPRPVTEDQELEIVSKHQAGVSRNQLARDYPASRWLITDILKRHGIARRSISEASRLYSLDESVFDNAESNEEAAYWAGVLMADGCISHIQYSSYVILGLKESDADHVRRFVCFLKSEQPVRFEKPSTGNAERVAVIHIASQKLVAALARYGVVARKSLTSEVRLLEANRHFWRGLVDGDGWVGYGRCSNGRYIQPIISVTGSAILTGQFCSYRASFCASVSQPVQARGRKIWQVPTAGKYAVDIARHLYEGCTIAMPRKFAVAKQIGGF